MQRTYEVMFIVRPDMPEEAQERLISTLESQVSAGGGKIANVERMGKRRLAYVVRKFQEGLYVLLTVESTGAVVAELERRLRVSEPVIKFITVRVDEEQKRLAKVKAIRDSKKRRPVEAPAPPPAPAAAPAPAESAAEPTPATPASA
jgi:small subunit ribosomal protein S6